MLQSMRQATKSWAARGVIIILALSFGAFGINDVFTGGSRTAVATVGDVEVPTVLFDRQFQRALQRERERSGRPDLTRDEAHRAGLTGQVLNLLVREYLLDAETSKLGMRAADDSVRRELEDSPAFSNEQGAFDPELYDLVLERNNMTRTEYEDLIRVDLLRSQLLNAIGGERKVPESLIEALHRFRAEERSAGLALIPARGMRGLAVPDEAALTAYYEANTASFMAPERRSAVVVQLTAEAMVSEIELSDEDVYAEYEARIDEFDLPAQRAVVQINAQDEALIREGAQRLAEGEPFDAVADRSQEPWRERSHAPGIQGRRPAEERERGGLQTLRGLGQRPARDPVRLASLQGRQGGARAAPELRGSEAGTARRNGARFGRSGPIPPVHRA